MGTSVAEVGAEEEEDIGIARTVSMTIASTTAALLMPRGGRTCQAPAASSMTQTAPRNLNPTTKGDSLTSHRPGGTRHPRMSSSSNRQLPFEHQEDQMEVDGEALASLEEEARAVDYFYRLALPSASNLSSQLYHPLGICGCVFTNVANHLTIARECQSIKSYACDLCPMRQGIIYV